MKKVLLSKDYTLIVGMPGTGKTTTICALVSSETNRFCWLLPARGGDACYHRPSTLPSVVAHTLNPITWRQRQEDAYM